MNNSKNTGRLQVVLPSGMKEWATKRVQMSGQYSHLSDYVRALIRADQANVGDNGRLDKPILYPPEETN